MKNMVSPVGKERDRPKPVAIEMTTHTVEEVAAWLSACEGKPVTVEQVRMIEAQALRKLRRLLVGLGMGAGDLLP